MRRKLRQEPRNRCAGIGAVAVVLLFAGAAPARTPGRGPASSAKRSAFPVSLKGFRGGKGLSIRKQGDALAVGWTGSDRKKRGVSFDLAAEAASFRSITYRGRSVVTRTRLSAESISGSVQNKLLYRISHENGNMKDYAAASVTERVAVTYPVRSCIVTGDRDRAKVTFTGLKFGSEPGRVVYRFYNGVDYFSAEFRIDGKPTGVDRDIEVALSGFEAGREVNSLWRFGAGKLSARKRPQIGVERTLVREKIGGTGTRGDLWTFGRIIVLSGPAGAVGLTPSAHRWTVNSKRPIPPLCGFSDDAGGRRTRAGLRLYKGRTYGPNNTMGTCRYFVHVGRSGPAVANALRRLSNGDRWPKVEGWTNFLAHVHEATQDFAEFGLDVALEAQPHYQTWRDRQKRLAFIQERNRKAKLLLVPGEEVVSFLGGYRHVLTLFPKPVIFSSFADSRGKPVTRPPEGIPYLGSAEEAVRFFEQNGGLLWQAHPGEGAPVKKFLKSPLAASSAVPGMSWQIRFDDAEKVGMGMHRLYYRYLNLGHRKFQISEVDWNNAGTRVPRDRYASASVNYARIRRPASVSDCAGLVAAIREGKFFVTSGEIFIHDATLDGRPLPATLRRGTRRHAVKMNLAWTWPLERVEFVRGYGKGDEVRAQIAAIRTGTEHGRKTFTWNVDLSAALWMRVEVYDIAGNFAYTQPVFLGAKR